ncbi:MAG: universal stress protein [Anaerolineae bacterium]|nr:universal stress protein [Anaerolineae bacterium]
MGPVICATRGGQGSRAAQLGAIRYARDLGTRLTFLYVVDIRMLGDVDEKLVAAVRSELQWLGQALLRVAKQRAEHAGIDVDIVIREGIVRDEIVHYLQDSHAALLVLGAPRGTSSQFGDDSIELFARSIEEDAGVSVQVIRPEDVP